MTAALVDQVTAAMTEVAGRIILPRYQQLAEGDVRAKTHPADLVTIADEESEHALTSALKALLPGSHVVGEEAIAADPSTLEGLLARDPLWIIDPIDGTANFMRGVPIWGTLIALAIDGVPLLGVVSSPALGKRWWAARGQGAWSEERGGEAKSLRVSGVADLADASLSYNSLKGWDDEGRVDEVIALSRRVWRTRAIGDMWAYMLLAEGAIDIVGELDMKPWDIAALIPIVEEAGGRMTAVDGTEGPWAGSALATNGILHDAVLEAFASTKP
jgi:histidinol-phosphatase